VRGTILHKRKYYFLADLKKLYGSKFVTYLPAEPISLRIAVAGNSQTRQLVNVSEFKDSFRKYKKTQTSKTATVKAVEKKPKKTIATQLEMNFSTPQNAVKSAASEAPVSKTESDMIAKTFRRNINRTIEEYSKKEISATDNLDVDIESALKEKIVKNYLKAYAHFDKGLASSNNISINMLDNYGLGRKARSNGVKYLDTIQSKGLLDYLAAVVEHLFGNK
jgi:hypothetical protein